MNTLNTRNNFKTSKIGEAIYIYKGNTLVGTWTETTGRLYTYNLSKAARRKVAKVISATLRENKITKVQANNFYNDLRGTIADTENCCDILNVELIAKRMGISIKKANAFCNAMIKYKIVVSDDGMIII